MNSVLLSLIPIEIPVRNSNNTKSGAFGLVVAIKAIVSGFFEANLLAKDQEYN